jgi:UTP--glucose-1-phosphate uridylyltransferase
MKMSRHSIIGGALEQNVRKVREAVFPVAGLGTRFLPATKAAEGILPVVAKPVIQYVVDDAQVAWIEHFIFVTGRNKTVIEDHFDAQVELYETWPSAAKTMSLRACSGCSRDPDR